MAPPSLTVLRAYAHKRDPSKLPLAVHFAHTPTTLTVFDAFPKALFHLLVLPRPALAPELSPFDLASLRALLRHKDSARRVLLALREAADAARATVREEMRARYGFEWDVWTGFHAVPSMEHVHLHVISADLCNAKLKTKKHYNSFHPALGFFLPLDTVLEWLDATPSYYDTMARLEPGKYEPLLKAPLECFRCGKTLGTVPALKTHLQDEWDTLRARSLARGKRKRDSVCDAAEAEEPRAKKAAVAVAPRDDGDAMDVDTPPVAP
ncbi:hypothetical protein FA95DRAFT_1559820 [Auriscalpium vulgare]|uniref:Uncharacterized protein n=1 Tax=Auriscalpium vulgare TaxID=40419 RepID=A0ACB8RS29_9AGAM|nr:hypothetical protein FA95DRAFT_1559820 [Auriscalpium vulgare]